MQSLDNAKIAIVGLGYVGLPLAVEFGKQFEVTGFDIHVQRIEELRNGFDHTQETSSEELASAKRLGYTTDLEALRQCNVFIITVPTPVDEHKRPDFTPLIKASQSVGKVLKRSDVVIYESTVYPGATEEVCIPELERVSGLRFNVDFTAGYSPERINPGDKQRRLVNIPKITSGSTPEAAEFVDSLYRRIIQAGTHKASSLKVAEAAKVIENTQRDANIALINEFALIFHRLGIDTTDVLEAAGTKWNFLPFRPGLVGGHCIGVDPYYLIQKAQSVGYHPDILLSCRRINDAMGQHVASEVVKLMIGQGHAIKDSRVLVLGFTFKENCPDLRNTRVVDLVKELESFGAQVDIHDPWADAVEAKAEYGLDLLATQPVPGTYDAVVVAVAHDEFKAEGSAGMRALGNHRAVLYDIKGILPKEEVDGRL
ncbi:Vi polysaccharide biosynthesis UDP-N-acetylglucosamine C-6 dehydrogenase TviB [Rhodanobacter sp. DHB23]|uniref:Vi polysaccharide biosynthesis UDP-N-acetylglucosamine C-6 dehydrogenase TviB n=1 Tax=Rhodanobacter sp. DHB23 TaxID=2775923 RepID=UPI0017827C93|nr:Vi polysaccharide biosynthesis UDP-N-acetylglucosamine C-6 dehydrogenase TviB [Rhodanobacter sp. DHB23]MBD8872844.1 Vi polysaccharide biosynthesis UDP-N-acetylglucosamine C-6 dehydrogenase TviB [Rhodanobacter sp. DHB23]